MLHCDVEALQDGRDWKGLSTLGDGACGIHAVFGHTDSKGQLRHEDPRGWIRRTLQRCPSFEALQDYVRRHMAPQTGQMLLESIRNLIVGEGELLQDFLQGVSWESNQEANIFGEILRDNNAYTIGVCVSTSSLDPVEGATSSNMRLLQFFPNHSLR